MQMPRPIYLLVLTLALCSEAAVGQSLTVTVQVQDEVCGYGNGCITAFASGGVGPYSFQWDPVPPNGQGTPSICGLFAGTYTVTVTDSNGDSETVSATVNGTTELLFDTSPGVAYTCSDPCNGYWSRSGTMGGSGPYTATVLPPAGTANAYVNGVEVFGLCEGTSYSVSIVDANGCQTVVNEVTVMPGGPPQVVSISQQGPCQGFANGWAQVFFDQNISQVTVVSGTGTLNWSGNTLYLTGMGVGPNVFNVMGASPLCMNQFVIEVDDGTTDCGTIEGSVHADIDADCEEDPTDPAVPFRLLRVQPGNYLAITDGSGNYTKGAPYGSHTIANDVSGMGTDCMAQHPVPVELNVGQPAATVDFLLTPMSGPDAMAFITAGWFRPGFATTITASVRNNNAFVMQDIDLAVDFDPLLVYDSSPNVPSVLSPGHVEWVIPALQPYETIHRSFVVDTPNDVALIGTNVNMTASIAMPTADADPANDTYGIIRTIVGSYDPNDKLAETSSGASRDYYYLDLDDFVDFTIRFQNTGTAEAINIFLLDTVSTRFELESFEFLASSHPVGISIEDDRVLRFDFPEIWLPDSTADPLGSQGFVTFRLKPMNDVLVGGSLTNVADIYFDFNEPIRTNTAVLAVDVSSGIATEWNEVALSVAPNPAHDRLRVIATDAQVGLVDVIDPAGRLMIGGVRYRAPLELDVSALASGMYIVRLRDESGAARQARFVKH